MTPAIAIRTGDTPAAERARFQREPADILITTPESLYLLLTSNARDALRGIETIIIDEIHALVPTKRGAHLARVHRTARRALRSAAAAHRPLRDAAAARRSRALSRRRRVGRPPASAARPRAARRAARGRAGASAGPYDEEQTAIDIGNEFAVHARAVRYRPVTIVDAGAKKALNLTIEVPVEDMARLHDRRRAPERSGVGRRHAPDRSGRRFTRASSS